MSNFDICCRSIQQPSRLQGTGFAVVIFFLNQKSGFIFQKITVKNIHVLTSFADKSGEAAWRIFKAA